MTNPTRPAHLHDQHEDIWAAIEQEREQERIGAMNAEIRDELRKRA